MKKLAFLTLAAMSLAWPSLSRAEAIISIYDDGTGNVVASGSGTLDTNGLTLIASNLTGASGVYGSGGLVAVGTGVLELYYGVSGPSSFGSGGDITSSSATGQYFGASATGYLFTPNGYVSGSSLLGSETFSGASLTSLGLTPGTYTYTWATTDGKGSDSLTVDIGDSFSPFAVPEPGSMALVLSAGLIGLGARSWSRRRAARG